MQSTRGIEQPGCKFDEILVLISETQGTDKSTAVQTLTGKAEWFSDSFALNLSGKEVIEQLRGRWIIEVPELKGLSGAKLDAVKAMLRAGVGAIELREWAFWKAAPEKWRERAVEENEAMGLAQREEV